VTERTATIARIRHLARQVAEAWLAERRALGFPLLQGPQRQAWLAAESETEAEQPAAEPPAAAAALLPLA
jgi:hypothetical protein